MIQYECTRCGLNMTLCQCGSRVDNAWFFGGELLRQALAKRGCKLIIEDPPHVAPVAGERKEGEGTRPPLSENCTKTDMTSDFNEADGIRKALSVAIDFAEWGWSIIANAHGGNWELESKDWQEAAAKYRDRFHDHIRFLGGVPMEISPKPSSEGLT